MNIYRLYPQYNISQDRRQLSVPVQAERRSGEERRSPDRIKLDTNLTKDIFVLRDSVSKLQNAETIHPNKALQNIVDNVPFARKLIDNIKTFNSQELNKDQNDTLKRDKNVQHISTSKAAAGAAIGVLGAILGSLLIGPAAAVVGVGVGVYFGAKLVKNIVATHIKNE